MKFKYTNTFFSLNFISVINYDTPLYFMYVMCDEIQVYKDIHFYFEFHEGNTH